jgi:hypothetical protein
MHCAVDDVYVGKVIRKIARTRTDLVYCAVGAQVILVLYTSNAQVMLKSCTLAALQVIVIARLYCCTVLVLYTHMYHCLLLVRNELITLM